MIRTETKETVKYLITYHHNDMPKGFFFYYDNNIGKGCFELFFGHAILIKS